MLTNGKKECPFTDEIVSYMYGDIDGVEREGFEMHLAECTTCTDDFAAISNARFSVFEWRKEEFDHLATPSFIIPELAKPVVEDVGESGWFGALAGLVSFARSPLAVAAALLVFLGVGFIALSYFRSSEPLIAKDAEVKAPEITNVKQNKKQVDDPAPKVITPDNVIEPTKAALPIKHAPLHRSIQVKRAVNNVPKRNSSPQTASKKPVLNDFKEDADNSLRLADLFDEVGG